MLLPLHSCLCSAVLVAGCMATLANSQALQVATGSTRIGNDHPLEQRYAVGMGGPQFGSDGRGFLIAPGRRAMAAPCGNGRVADTLPLPDGSVLVVGAIDYQQDQRAALWRCRRDGVLDTSFAAPGLLVAAGLPDSEGLSIHRNADGSLNIAVQATRADKIWLEVHDWKTGAEAPQRFSRQAMPVNWVGPAVLERRGNTWVWSDASQPWAVPLEVVAITPKSLWKSVAVAPAPAVPSAPGHAVLNPFGETGHRGTALSSMNAHAPAWPSAWVVLFIAAVSGATWWLRRA